MGAMARAKASKSSKNAGGLAPQTPRDAFETRAIHAGQEPDPTTGAVVVPIHPTTTYAQDGLGGHKGFEYSRTGNPTRKALETCIASLEGGARGLAFASGMATLTTISFLLEKGDHVVLEENAYGGTVRYFNNIANRMGIEVDYVDCSKLQNVEDAFRKDTKMLIAETPTNPNLKLNDIEKIADVTHEHGALLVIDNTFATPYLQQPLALGADLVYHSATKYLGGHSDSVSGVLVAKSPELGDKLAYLQNAAGAILSPFDSYLVLRGIKTLGVRMDRHGANALELAKHLEAHPKVEYVNYPYLEAHPQHKLARRQMKNGSGLISFEVKGGLAGAKKFLKDTGVWTLAESLGAVESLICHPVSMTHGSIPKAQRERAGITDGLLRLSVGLENVEDLRRDLDRGLAKV